MIVIKNTAIAWLIENGHQDVADLIHEIMDEWKRAGNKQRRNWWDILAGSRDGKPRIIAGRKMPVLRAARLRRGWESTENAIGDDNEKPVIPVRSSPSR